MAIPLFVKKLRLDETTTDNQLMNLNHSHYRFEVHVAPNTFFAKMQT